MKPFLLLLALCFGHAVCAQQLMGDAKSQFDFAVEKYKSASYTSSVEYCTNIINNVMIDKRNKVDVYKLRAMAYRAQGDYTKAALDYTEVIQWGRRDPQVYLNIAQVYMCQKNFGNAEQALNEAARLFQQSAESKSNFYLLEEFGRLQHYLGNYREAVLTLKEAVENGSTMATIDLLSALLRSKEYAGMRLYSDTLLAQQKKNGYGLLSDSSLYYYVSGINGLTRDVANEQLLQHFDKAQSFYRNSDKCFQGFYSDILAAKAYVHGLMNNDSLAYGLYLKIFALNNAQPDVRQQIADLRIKLKLDMVPPQLVIKNPIVDEQNLVTMTNTARYEMYGQVTDSSGIASLQVNGVPVTKIEDDGLFVFHLDLQPGKNDVEIVALDKFDNRTARSFVINNLSESEARPDDLNTIAELTASATFHAILIAENAYADPAFNDLNQPAAQVAELRSILVKQYEFEDKNVMTIIDGTKTAIMDSLEKKTAAMGPNDNLLIYYAGHGKLRKIGSNIEGGYLVPADAKKDKWHTFLSSHEIKSTLKETEAKHVLFVVDACFAGALLSRATLEGAPPGIVQSYKYSSRKMLTSGNLEEVPDNGKFYQNLKSFFTQNTQRYTTAQDLATFVMTNKEGNNPQYERIPDMPNEFGGQFVFIRRQ